MKENLFLLAQSPVQAWNRDPTTLGFRPNTVITV
jgi:hypothetical protein